MNQLILNPLEDYEKTFKNAHAANTEAFFQALADRSGVNPEENRAAVQKYKAQQEKADSVRQKAGRWKTLRVLTIIGIVLTVIGMQVAFAQGATVAGILLLALAIGFVVLWLKKLNPTIKNLDVRFAKEDEAAEKLQAMCWQQMAPLNRLFRAWDGIEIFEKTIPMFDFKQSFSKEQEKDMLENYNLPTYDDPDHTVIDSLSGTYRGNPFLFERRRIHKMGTETYHGYKTITWTERYTDSNGKRRTRTRSQTLHATVTKPKPFYHTETYLHYGAQAGPDLSFSRLNKHLEDKSERAIDAMVRRGERKLQDKAEDALSNNQNFMGMTNTEFDVLFDALDRDHEVQFRVLFTPLAQTNMLDLLRSETGYGDDFDFFKRRRMNTIVSEHSQTRSLLTDVSKIRSYDYDVARQNFLSGHAEFFKAVYFDFAPLLALPVYQEEPVQSLNPLPDHSQKYSIWEYETLANAMNPAYLTHPKTKTPAILKASCLSADRNADQVGITAHSYESISRTDVVPMWGGDGRMHHVHVHWDEYLPLTFFTRMQVSAAAQNNPDAPAQIHTHGLYACVQQDQDIKEN
jgi:hypothetical protein